MLMIQAIVYDAVGTLIHVQPAVASIYAEIGRAFGSRLDETTIRHRFPIAFARQEQLDADAGWRTSEEREIARWRAVVAEVLDDVADPGACFAALFDRFGKPEVWRCADEASGLLAELHRLGYRQALASNFDRRLRNVIAPLPIAPYVDLIVVSSEVGWRKPAPEFFRGLAGTLRLPMDAILFVGDDLENDYKPAVTVGMQAVLVDPVQRHVDVEGRIEKLADLRELI
jgi:putative hydrolase of the HAD superfamily